MQNINWGRLVEQGRAKAIGIPWNNEEIKALNKGVKPEDVRAGILKQPKPEKQEDIPLERKSKDELLKIAEEKGVEIADKKAISRGDLLLAIQTLPYEKQIPIIKAKKGNKKRKTSRRVAKKK